MIYPLKLLKCCNNKNLKFSTSKISNFKTILILKVEIL